MTVPAEARAMTRHDHNNDQALVAHHLIDAARARLAGRDPSGQELVDVRPRERVVLGVLLPQLPPANAQPASAASAVPYEPGVPIDQLPVSEMGLSVLIDPDSTQVTLHVQSQVALYLQHTPTHAQQAEHSGLPENESAADDDPDADDESALTEHLEGTRPEDTHDPDSAETPQDEVPSNLPAPPSDGDLAGLSADAAAAVRLAVQGAQTAGQGTGHSGAASSDFLRPVYRRYDVTVTHDLTIQIPADARPHTVGEQIAYECANADAVALGRPERTGHYAGALLIPMRGPSAMRVARSVVETGEAAYETHLRDNARSDWATPVPTLAFHATTQRTPDGQMRLAVTLINTSPQPQRDRGFLPEYAVYDAGFRVAVDGATICPSEYRLVERDYRTQPLVHAHGRFCCLDEDAFAQTGELVTTTLPIHRQMVYESKPELRPSFEALAATPLPPLEQIEQHMSDYLDAWSGYLETAVLSPLARQACEREQAAFADELRRYRRGLQLIREDLKGPSDGLGVAFMRANESFALMNTRGGLDNPGSVTATTWRLFQIVYVVSNLASLAAREALPAERVDWLAQRQTGNDMPRTPSDLDELAVADVLWFPTGGGKSAALYGIVAVGLFFDRLRGKHAGVSSVIRFPLRMLSVQQLERVLRLVVACEMTRSKHRDPGDPFRLGYWVGRNNTPNKITDPGDERWHDLAWMARQNADWKREHTVLPTCPYCGLAEVALNPDVGSVTLAHRCGSCGQDLPVDVSDDEVYRNLPAVLVATVDKIASLAFNAHASHLTHGPAFRCPDHGFVTHAQGYRHRCLARDNCTRVGPADWEPVAIKDPAPALVIQDELHLLSEELGTFAAHYETLWQHLCTVGSGLPSKVLAATATISDYENQVAQLYALTPRRFPTDGWADGDSFYAARHDTLVRRLFVGALPTQMDVVQFAIAASDAVRQELGRLNKLDPQEAIEQLELRATQPGDVADLLFQYELQCFYCNRKTHADQVHARAERLGHNGDPAFRSVRLNGQTPLAEISDVIRRVEREDLTVPAADRLGSIAGTSLISHGVDLERLNVMFILGMPSTVSYYVQATSRAGRNNVGIVFTTLARHFVRDRSVFHFFDAQHRYVNVLVEPVALNRFSVHGPRKTASGVLAAVLTQQWGRDPNLLSAAGLTAPADLTKAVTVRRILSAMRTAAAADEDANDAVGLAQRDARDAFGVNAQVLDAHIAQRFAESIDQQIVSLLASVEASHSMLLTKSLRPTPPMSLRDIDVSADFGTANGIARRRFEFLGAPEYDNDEADFAIADGQD
jgi:hypothetical protein